MVINSSNKLEFTIKNFLKLSNNQKREDNTKEDFNNS